MQRFAVEIIQDYKLQALEDDWLALERLGNASVFRSWTWISCWLAALPDEIQPLLVRVTLQERTVGLGFLCSAKLSGKFGKVGAFLLHETGNTNLDCLTVEHNGLLCDPAHEEDVISQVGRALEDRKDWDEWVVSGIDSITAEKFEELAARMGWIVYESVNKPRHFLDLAKVKQLGDRLEWLSVNTRSQVRRALKDYGKRGEVKFELARTVDEALAFFDRLKYFHQCYWQSRAKQGAFELHLFEIFHRRFIEQSWSTNGVQLARVSSGDHEIGYLYNLVHQQTVYAYQSGFNYEKDAKVKPGLVSHVMAIERAIADGFDCYDLLAGDGQYKRSLATDSEMMRWIRLRRPRIAFRLEALARKVRDRSRETFGALFRELRGSPSNP